MCLVVLHKWFYIGNRQMCLVMGLCGGPKVLGNRQMCLVMGLGGVASVR